MAFPIRMGIRYKIVPDPMQETTIETCPNCFEIVEVEALRQKGYIHFWYVRILRIRNRTVLRCPDCGEVFRSDATFLDSILKWAI